MLLLTYITRFPPQRILHNFSRAGGYLLTYLVSLSLVLYTPLTLAGEAKPLFLSVATNVVRYYYIDMSRYTVHDPAL